MEANVESAKMQIDKSDLPHGVYHHGKWTGGVVKVEINGTLYELEVSVSLRGIDIPCTVTIGADSFKVEAF